MADNESNNKNTGIPETSSSKPMDSKRDVAQSPDKKTDQDFPGYPHYPAKEDIMHQSTGSHRVDANLEETGTAPNHTGVSQRFPAVDKQTPGTDGTNEEIGLPQNVSNEDLQANTDLPGTDIDEAAEKGSTNP